MIKDNIKNIENHFDLPERVELGLKYLTDTSLANIKNGKHDFLGDDIYVNIQDYTSKLLEKGKFEAHNKSSETEYNKEKDIIFLKQNKEGASNFINLKANEFAIFTPKDAKIPSIVTKTASHETKAVVKVSI